jgi:glycosyltransferase involved in cell wall biosynthesis
MLIILARKYKYLNNFGLIHLNHQYSTSKNCFNNDNYYLGVLFCGNTLFDYHINNNPKDIEIFTHYYSLFKNDFEKGKKFFPKLYSFLINKAIFNEYLSSKQKEFFLKQINLKESSSELIENYEYENIYNYQISDISNNKSNNIYIPNPKISIILFFTENKYLDKTINSIQNQNFTNYELILVFDNKEQNDIDLIQKYIKKNPNINLINNKNNRGLLYSISIGALSSKGKYILILEPGSTLAKENTLIELYNIISNEKLDILEFNLLINNQDIINKNSLILYRCLHFKSKLNLEKIKYNKNYPKIDQQKELLINKLIRADLFKNSIEKYNLNKIQREAYNYYDNIFLYVLQKTNKKFNHTNIYGVIKNNYYFNSLNINKIIENKKQKIKDTIFYINFILENSYNSFEEKKFVLNEYFNVMSIIYNKFNSINSESSNLYNKFMKCKYITQFDKTYLKFYYNSLTN